MSPEQRLDDLLARAGESLRSDQVDAADHAVADAIRLAPGDARALNLLGLVRFRAGRYDEAWQVYRDLVARDPDDSALQLNLGLVELRLGRNAEAAQSLRRVVEQEPANAKAQGYLGLALMRAGELTAARAAFVAAGQTELVRQVDQQLASAPQAAGGAAPSVASPDLSGRLRVPATLHVDAIAPLAAVEAIAPLTATALLARAPAVPEGPVGAMPLIRFTDRAEVRPLPGEPYTLTSDGFLAVRVDGRLPMRTVGAVASSGRLAYAPILRRHRGRTSEEPFGDGDDALVAASGTGLVLVSPRALRFTALRLAETLDVLYLRETAVFSFEESLLWENGRVPGGGATAVEVVQFRGQGRLVMRSRKAPMTLKLGGGEVYYVDQGALLGWIGQVVPQQLRGIDGEPTQYISCSGEGALIIEEPPPVLQEIPTPG